MRMSTRAGRSARSTSSSSRERRLDRSIRVISVTVPFSHEGWIDATSRRGLSGTPRAVWYTGDRARAQRTPPMIQVQHLTKRYGPITAISDVSFTVDKGQIVGFLGPNGAGTP